MKEGLVTYELAVKLKEKGFDERCEWTFYNHYRVRDEIYEKHPGLSDCGYDDLKRENGGPYKSEEVYGYYIEPVELYSRNSIIGIHPITKERIATQELCSCPYIYQVLKWLRDKLYHIEIVANASGYLYIVSDIPSEGGTDRYCSDYEGPNDGGAWDSYEDCVLDAMEYVIDNLI